MFDVLVLTLTGACAFCEDVVFIVDSSSEVGRINFFNRFRPYLWRFAGNTDIFISNQFPTFGTQVRWNKKTDYLHVLSRHKNITLILNFVTKNNFKKLCIFFQLIKI